VDVFPLATTIVSAFVVTFVTVVVPSPSTVTASRYAVRRGTRTAAVFLAAVLCLDTAVYLVLIYGIHPFLHYVGAAEYLVPLAGAGLMIVGLVMIVTARRKDFRLLSISQRPELERGGTARGPFLAGLLVPAANPGFWIWWTTVGTSFIHAARPWGPLGLGLLLIAFIGGAATWYAILLWALRHGRQVFSESIQDRVLVALGLVMIGFGAVVFFRGLAYFR
jgi:threonine/homoserine/homoserine lactone efflux protein